MQKTCKGKTPANLNHGLWPYKPTDNGEKVVAENGYWKITGEHGILILRPDGGYTYTVTNGKNVPHQGYTETFNITVTDDGDFAHTSGSELSSNGSLVIHLSGQNTPPTATVTGSLNVTEDAYNSINGLVISNTGSVSEISDNDGDNVSVSVGTDGEGAFGSYAAGQYGALFLKPDGTFYYQLNNALPEVQELKPGGDKENLTETFVVRLDDGHGGITDKTVTVNITGAEDKPMLILLGGENDDVPGAGRSLDMLKTDSAVHGKGLVFDVDHGDAEKAVFSLHGVGDSTGESPYTEDDGKTYAMLNGGWKHIGTFSINKLTGAYSFTPTDAILGLKLGKQISFDIKISVNGGQENPNGTEGTVTVTVTGTDSAPIITGFTGSDQVTEDGTRTAAGQLSAFDPDAEDGELHYTVLGDVKTGPTTWQGDYGTLKLNPDGSYTYTLDNSKAQQANVDKPLYDVFKVAVIDGAGAQSESYDLRITIQGVNDLPVISNIAPMTAVTEDGVLTSSGSMTVRDVDDTLTSADFTVGLGAPTDNTGLTQKADGAYGSLEITAYNPTAGQLSYSYTLNNSSVQSLGRNARPVEKFTILVDDGHGTLVSREVTVTVNGANDAPTLSAPTDMTVTETDTPADRGTVIGGNFNGSDIDVGDTVTFVVTGGEALTPQEMAGYTHKVAGLHGTLYYNKDTGANKYVCNGNVPGGESKTDTFEVKAYDGLDYSAGKTLTVTVSGNADKPVVSITGNTSLQAADHENGATSVTLTLSIMDPDEGDNAHIRFSPGAESDADWSGATGPDNNGALSLTGEYGTLALVNGKLVYNLSKTDTVQALRAGDTGTDTFTVLVQDDTGLTVTREVLFTVKGTNDTPVISSIEPMDEVTENISVTSPITGSGWFTVSDADDALASLTAAVINPTGSYGSLEVTYDGDGTVNFTYTLDPAKAQKLGLGDQKEENFIIRVTDGHGGHTDQQVSVTVLGSNDNPVMSLSHNGTLVSDAISVVEDAAHTGATVSLGLTYDDVDLNDHDLLAVRLSHQDASAPAETGLDGLYGTLRLVGGELVYTVDRSLGTGSNRVDVFTVRVSDAHGGYVEQTVSFNVTSYNEPPVVGVGAGGLLNIDKAAEHVADIADIADGRLLNILPLTGAMDLNFSDMETPTELLQLSLRGAGDDFLQTDSDGIAHIPGAFGTLIFDKNDGGYMYTLNTDDLTTLRALAQSGSLGLNDSFTVRVTDEEGLSSDVTFTVHIDAEGMTAVNENSHYWSGRIDNTVLFGTDGDDRMSVTGADNFIYGGDGDDVITVSGEGNLLFGGDGNDLFIVNGSAGIHNRYDGGGGLDFLVGLTDMDSVDSLFAGGELENIDVVLVGNAGIANMNHLAGLGLQATPDGKLAIDSRWTQQDADAVPEHAVGYTAYTTSVTQANGGSETLTALVNNELLRSETGGNG